MSRHRARGSNEGRCEPCVEKKKHGHRDARDAKYCLKHQCPVQDRRGVFCTSRKKGLEEKCEFHTTCEFSGCSLPRKSDETNIPHSFCTEHACRVEGCAEGKVYKPSTNVHSDLCASHILSKCILPTCVNWKDGGILCKLHTCTVDNCDKRTFQDRPFCSDHNTCTSPQCTAERLQLDDQFEMFCEEHYLPQCIFQSCTKDSQQHSEYCSLHSCRYQGCSAKAQPAKKRPYCDRHKCHIEGCQALPNFSSVNSDLKINKFCIYHECQDPKCTDETAPDKPGACCVSHCCIEPTCKEAKENGPWSEELCLYHHEEKLKEKGRQEVLDDLAAQEQAIEEDKMRQAGREPRPYRHTPQSDYPSNSYVDDEYDQGYRSNRKSDSYQMPHRSYPEQGRSRHYWSRVD